VTNQQAWLLNIRTQKNKMEEIAKTKQQMDLGVVEP
jgi:hypothetical protein